MGALTTGGNDMTTHDTPSTRFAHHRLDDYRVALEQVEVAAAGFPRGHADLKDQLRRAAAAPVRAAAATLWQRLAAGV